MTEARVPVMDDALVEKVADAIEAAWDRQKDLPPIEFTPDERVALARAAIETIRERGK